MYIVDAGVHSLRYSKCNKYITKCPSTQRVGPQVKTLTTKEMTFLSSFSSIFDAKTSNQFS